MWRNPDRYPAEPEVIAPPEERGVSLAVIPRGQGEQLRVSLDEFNGAPFVSLRVWALGTDGTSWWPTKKGCSVRIREIQAVGQALATALREVRAHEGRPALDQPRTQGRPQPPARRPAPGPRLPIGDPELPPASYRDGFDEFEGGRR